MDLIDQHNTAICRATEFIFRVHEDHARLACYFLAPLKHSKSRSLHLIPGVFIQQAFFNDFLARQALIMPRYATLRRGGDDRFGQCLILA